MNGVASVAARSTPYTANARSAPTVPAAGGQTRSARIATKPSTAVSQIRRPRRAAGTSSRARNASIGEMREARMAGSMAPATVTPRPTRNASTRLAALSPSTWAEKPVRARMDPAISRPSPPPIASPASDPMMPNIAAPASTNWKI